MQDDVQVGAEAEKDERHRSSYARGILLTIAYDGEQFSGLAVQGTIRTVGGELQKAILAMDPNAGRIRVCSRTDKGVHARQQYVVFDTNKDIGMRGWLLGLCGHLPREITVHRAARVDPGFRVSKRAIQKTYRYLILQGTLRDPFLEGRAWRVSERLNHENMRRAAKFLEGTHDFRAFRGSSDSRSNTVRTIHTVTVEPLSEQPRVLAITVTGTAFLFNMVRIICGTLVDIVRENRDPSAIRRAIRSGDRLDLGMTAPAAGLYLERIDLAEGGTDEWPYHLDGEPRVPKSVEPRAVD